MCCLTPTGKKLKLLKEDGPAPQHPPKPMISTLPHTAFSPVLLAPTGKKLKLLKDGDPTLLGDHIREGLGGIVSVKVGVQEDGWA